MVNIIYITALIAVFIVNTFALDIKMKTLHLTAADHNSKVDTMLDAYGMSYETIHLPATTLTLEKDNAALYNVIVIEEATQAMLAGIKEQIQNFQKKYKVRVAYLNTEPDTSFGVTNFVKTLNMRNATLTNEGFELAQKYQMNGKDVDFNIENCVYNVKAPNNCDAYNHYEVILDTNNDVIPLFKLNFADATGKSYYGGAIFKNNGLESIHFWFPYIHSELAYFSSHLWISWANYGMIDGYRRLYFGIQIDDFFIDNCFNRDSCDDVPDWPHYRTSVQDMINLAQWQKDVSGRLPEGSNIRIELAINGYHILTEAKHKESEPVDWTDYNTTYGYMKPLGAPGSFRWGKTIDSDWDDNILQSKDDLYKYFKEPKHQDDFFWLTHTFSHEKLDNASYYDADIEMKLNIKMSKQPYLGMYERPCYSPHSIVSPEISGLHNGDALKALTENEVYYAVGDTSRTDLNPGNFYLPFVSNMTTSNFDNFLAIPRQPTQCYWDCSTFEENLKYFKNEPNLKWPTVLNREAVYHVKNFIQLRHDPYMFHEGNLRNADVVENDYAGIKGKFGLMQTWVERMVIELRKYLSWPMISIKMDDLAQTYINRMNLENCKPEYVMVIDEATDIIKEIKVSTTGKGECKAPLFAMRDTGFDKSTVDTKEKIGKEPETAWVNLKEGESKSIKFEKEIKYNDETFIGKALVSGGGNESSLLPSKFSSLFSGKKLYIWIGGGVALLLAIVGGFIVIRKKRSDSSFEKINSMTISSPSFNNSTTSPTSPQFVTSPFQSQSPLFGNPNGSPNLVYNGNDNSHQNINNMPQKTIRNGDNNINYNDTNYNNTSFNNSFYTEENKNNQSFSKNYQKYNNYRQPTNYQDHKKQSIYKDYVKLED